MNVELKTIHGQRPKNNQPILGREGEAPAERGGGTRDDRPAERD